MDRQSDREEGSEEQEERGEENTDAEGMRNAKKGRGGGVGGLDNEEGETKTLQVSTFE